MAFDPSEPRDNNGKWAGGSARGHNAGKGNREIVNHVAAIVGGAARGVIEGSAANAVFSAVSGGYGARKVPRSIIKAAGKGALAGAKVGLSVPLAVLSGVAGAYAGHTEYVQNQIAEQHRHDSGQKLKR